MLGVIRGLDAGIPRVIPGVMGGVIGGVRESKGEQNLKRAKMQIAVDQTWSGPESGPDPKWIESDAEQQEVLERRMASSDATLSLSR